MRVAVAVALPARQDVIEVELAEGATVADAVAAACLPGRFPGLDVGAARWGIWGRACASDAKLREGDRVELLRPLAADAKDLRRARAGLRPASKRSRSGP